MSPPHIVCKQGIVTQSYNGSMSNTELCLMPGAIAHLTINPPAGGSWPKPTVRPSGVVSLDSWTVDANGVHLTVTARSHGTVTLQIAGVWRLQIAVA